VAQKNEELNQEFVEGQRKRLQDQREELLRVVRGVEQDQRERAEDEGDFTEHDSGDMSQSIFNREMDGAVAQQARERLGEVERALEKIEEGTYGLSDESGDPIPKGRLQALPEAIRTVEEQREREGQRRPPV
jgi:DnaK suppressor protein